MKTCEDCVFANMEGEGNEAIFTCENENSEFHKKELDTTEADSCEYYED